MRIEDRLFDMSVNIELFLDLSERGLVVSIFIRLNFGEERFDEPVIRFQKLNGVRLARRKHSRYSIDCRGQHALSARARTTLRSSGLAT